MYRKRMNVTILLMLSAWVTWAEKWCTPSIRHPGRQFIYSEYDTIDTKVFSCEYLEEKKYSKCINGVAQFPFEQTTLERYTDFTNNCINAFKSKTHYTDKYGFTSKIVINDTASVTTSYTCSGNSVSYIKTVNITLRDFTVTADLIKDKVTLPSGTTCKYSYGFCYDEKNNTNFVWEKKEKASLNCTKLRKHLLKDYLFYLTLNYSNTAKQKYLISKADEKYVALELDNQVTTQCGSNISKVKDHYLYVSEVDIEKAINTASPLENEFFKIQFEKKQKLYDFLERKCTTDFKTFSEFELAEYVFKTSIEIERIDSHLEDCSMKLDEIGKSLSELNKEAKNLQHRLSIIIVVIAICGVTIMMILLYSVVKKFIFPSITDRLKSMGKIRESMIIRTVESGMRMSAMTSQFQYEIPHSTLDNYG